MTAVVAGWGMPLGLITPLFTGRDCRQYGEHAGHRPVATCLRIDRHGYHGAALMAPLAALVFIIELSDSTC